MDNAGGLNLRRRRDYSLYIRILTTIDFVFNLGWYSFWMYVWGSILADSPSDAVDLEKEYWGIAVKTFAAIIIAAETFLFVLRCIGFGFYWLGTIVDPNETLNENDSLLKLKIAAGMTITVLLINAVFTVSVNSDVLLGNSALDWMLGIGLVLLVYMFHQTFSFRFANVQPQPGVVNAAPTTVVITPSYGYGYYASPSQVQVAPAYQSQIQAQPQPAPPLR